MITGMTACMGGGGNDLIHTDAYQYTGPCRHDSDCWESHVCGANGHCVPAPLRDLPPPKERGY